MNDQSSLEIWTEWEAFPDPRSGGFIHAPYGPGVYEVRRGDTKQLVLRGKGKHCAKRITSLLPTPLGSGTRNNDDKRQYMLEHIRNLEYRTCACKTDALAAQLETNRKNAEPAVFNT